MSATGNGTTLTFSAGSGWLATARVRQIGGIDFEKEVFDDSVLSTATNRQYVPGDLRSIGPMELEAYMEASNGLNKFPTTETVGTATLTYPLASSTEVTKANITGTAFISAFTTPTLTNDDRMVVGVRVQFDGKTGPTLNNGST